MQNYVYGFHLERKGDEVYFRFPKFQEIISAVSADKFKEMAPTEIHDYALDAIVAALQGRILTRGTIPADDNVQLMAADGFINVPVQQAMKIELFKLFKENTKSLAQFSRVIGKDETVARRLLDLRHRSWASEIELAIASFGKRLVHSWGLETALPPARQPREITPPNP